MNAQLKKLKNIISKNSENIVLIFYMLEKTQKYGSDFLAAKKSQNLKKHEFSFFASLKDI